MNNKINSVRWQQRFENYKKAFELLQKTVLIENPSDVERAGMIQFFEMTFELSWKLLKDYLEKEGYIVKSPREAIKYALQAQLIENGHVWMDALKDRNLTIHTYEEETAKEIENNIRNNYFPFLLELFKIFNEKLKNQ